MKKKYGLTPAFSEGEGGRSALWLVLSLLLAFGNLKAQEKTHREEPETFKKIKKFLNTIPASEVSTGYLFDKGFISKTLIWEFDSLALNPIANLKVSTALARWKVLYSGIQKSNMDSTIAYKSLNDFLPKKKEYYSTFEIPIGILNFYGNKLHDTIIYNTIGDKKQNKPINLKNCMHKVHIFAISPLLKDVYNKNISLVFDNKFVFGNTTIHYSNIEIDLLDGSNKHRFSCEQRVLIPLSYSCEGEKALKITLFSDKDTLECYTKINIAATGDEPKPAFIIHADSGKIIGRTKLKSTNPDFIEGQTDGTIFPGTDKQPIFDRPVIVAEGWDPQNEVHGEGKVLGVFDYYYNALKGYGYDIVVINFKGSSRSIQDNAADFNAIIKDINKLKNDNGSYHENIVIGECMGSLVARYGLLKMENELYDHQTGLYVSFDAPMGGANLPAGLQFVLDDLNDFDVISSLGLDGGEIQNLVNAQEAPIVKQMSLFYKGPNPDPMFNTYRAELTSMGGYPKKLRKITVINGSNTEELQTNSCTSGQKILNISANLPLWRCNIDAWSHTPDAYPLIERYTSEIYIPIGFGLYFWYENDNEPIEFNFGHYWWDNKAGGYLDKTNDVLTAVANAEVNEVQATNFGRGNITFTPTYSSLDADPILGFNENFYWSLGRVNYVAQKFTPFDDIYAQSKNTYHIRRDEDNIKPLFEKIFDYELMRNFLYLQNRTTNKKLAFTSKEIFVGNNIEPLTTTDRLSISTGDFIVDVGGDLKLKAENKIIFKPGSKVKRGGKLWAIIQSIQNLKSAQENTYIDQPILEKNENTYSVSNASKNSKYSWTLQPGNYQLSGNSVELPSNLRPGLYTLECKAENTNGSSALSTVVKVANTKAIISINTSVNSKAQKPWFKLLQNPVNANLEAAFCINSETPVRISLYNTQGLAVTTLIINKPNIGKNKVTINMSNLPIGMYYLKFESQLLTNNIKVVKIK